MAGKSMIFRNIRGLWPLTVVFLLVLSILSLSKLLGLRNHNREIVSNPEFSSTSIIERIIDGDTFVLNNGEHIRLIGVDTPEKGQPFYDSAVSLAESLLLGNEVRLEPDVVRRDKYGRELAYLFLDSVFYNQTVILAGMGLVYLFSENLSRAENLIQSQRLAREKRVGIWSLPPGPPEEYYLVPRGSYRFHRPLCPSVKNSDPARGRIFENRDSALDLGLSPCRNCRP